MATETRWEGAVLDKLTNNGERAAVIEKDVSELKSDTKQLKEDVSELKTTVHTIVKADVSELTSRIYSWLAQRGLVSERELPLLSALKLTTNKLSRRR